MKEWSKSNGTAINHEIFLHKATLNAIVKVQQNPGLGVAVSDTVEMGFSILAFKPCSPNDTERDCSQKKILMPCR